MFTGVTTNAEPCPYLCYTLELQAVNAFSLLIHVSYQSVIHPCVLWYDFSTSSFLQSWRWLLSVKRNLVSIKQWIQVSFLYFNQYTINDERISAGPCLLLITDSDNLGGLTILLNVILVCLY
jgi:hypothetical protein